MSSSAHVKIPTDAPKIRQSRKVASNGTQIYENPGSARANRSVTAGYELRSDFIKRQKAD